MVDDARGSPCNTINWSKILMRRQLNDSIIHESKTNIERDLIRMPSCLYGCHKMHPFYVALPNAIPYTVRCHSFRIARQDRINHFSSVVFAVLSMSIVNVCADILNVALANVNKKQQPADITMSYTIEYLSFDCINYSFSCAFSFISYENQPCHKYPRRLVSIDRVQTAFYAMIRPRRWLLYYEFMSAFVMRVHSLAA